MGKGVLGRAAVSMKNDFKPFRPLLLSPAGSPEALRAAIEAGADEVYLGGSAFNARIGAKNFDEDALVRAGERCRRAGVRLHVACNTLVFEREWTKLERYIAFLERFVRPDAYIVQDLGLAAFLRETYPRACLHASTQLRVHSVPDAPALRALGFRRAVLAREMGATDIRRFVRASGMETEVFAHGALCVSESGGCLMSAAIGGRSGNRGECAQPCRMRYNGAYPLSLKDLCLAERIPELCGMGVTALKLEGRMKSSDYVYSVTAVYRRLLDERRAATAREVALLGGVFSRGGFTDAFFADRPGRAMFGVRREEDRKKSAAACAEIHAAYPPQKRPAPGPAARTEIETPPLPRAAMVLPPGTQKGYVLRFEQRVSLPVLERYGPAASVACGARAPGGDGGKGERAAAARRL